MPFLLSRARSLTLIFGTLLSYWPQAVAQNPEAPSSRESNERAFRRLLEQQSAERLHAAETQVPREKRSAFRAAFQRGMAVFRERFDLSGFLNHYGKLTSIIYPVMFVVDHIILLTLFAIGEPELATAYWIFPGTSVETAISVTVAGQIDRVRVMRDLGLAHRPWQLWRFSRARRETLGSAEPNHLLAAISFEQESALNEFPRLRVLRNAPAESARGMGPYVSRRELEAIVGTTKEGQDFIRSIAAVLPQRQTYALMLIEFARASPETRDLLAAKVSERLATIPADSASTALRLRMLELQEAQSQISHLHQTLDAEVARQNLGFEQRMYRLLRRRLSLEDSNLHALFQRTRQRLNRLELAIWRDEMAALSEATTGNPPPPRFFRAEGAWNPNARIARFREEVAKLSHFLNEVRSLQPGDGFEAKLRRLLTREERELEPFDSRTRPVPRANINPREECLILFQRLMLF